VQPVSVLVSQDGLSVVSKGLSDGQRVVVDGQYKLRPGLKIAEAPAETAGSGAAS
jgi:multidrug efflux system membrane fusion protein